MACIICFDLSKIMRSLKSTKRPGMQVLKIPRDLQWIGDLRITAAYILDHVEINCGFEIWHIKPTRNPHFLKGPFSK